MMDAVAVALKKRIGEMLPDAPQKASIHTWTEHDLQGLAIDAMAAYDTARRAEEERAAQRQRDGGFPNDSLDDIYPAEMPAFFG